MNRAQRQRHEARRLLPRRPRARRGQRIVAQALQAQAVPREQVERPRGAVRIVPPDDDPVPVVVDVLVEAGHRGRDAGRAHVEGLQRRPVHPLHAAQLEHHVPLAQHLGHLGVAQPGDPAVDAVERRVAAMRCHQRHVVRLAHEAHGGERIVDALVG
jgi:hypothetical protein